MGQKVLVIGSGAREHTIAYTLLKAPSIDEVTVAPGNPGMLKDGIHTTQLSQSNHAALIEFVKNNGYDWVFVGPEVPLIEGIVDDFAAAGIKAFGPSKAAAQIEGSKYFAKQLMDRHNIPTAQYKTFSDLEMAQDYVHEHGAPIVIKADGLAAGKGVVVAMTKKEALEALEEMMGQEHRFGSAGSRVVIEEFMEGEECSLLCFTDGKTIVPMIPAQDHKRVFDGDKGSNTGGMGAYAPAPVMTEALKQKTLDTIIRPVIDALEKEGRPYSGCLYAGLMISGDSIKVVEFNCRFGDPETQAVLPLFDGDLAEVMYACATGTLRPDMVKWKSGAAVCVVMASGGYPGSYPKGIAITGLEEASKLEDVVVFHAGTKEVDGQIVTNGGRVLGVTAVDETIAKAKERAYGAVERIHFEGAQYRKDIAWRALNR